MRFQLVESNIVSNMFLKFFLVKKFFKVSANIWSYLTNYAESDSLSHLPDEIDSLSKHHLVPRFLQKTPLKERLGQLSTKVLSVLFSLPILFYPHLPRFSLWLLFTQTQVHEDWFCVYVVKTLLSVYIIFHQTKEL